MATSIEVVYVTRDNRIDLRLKADLNDGNGMQYQPLTAVSRMDVVVSGITVSSTNTGPDVIRWTQVGYATGEVRMWLGRYTYLVGIVPTYLPSGRYDAPLIVYDPSNPNGIVWGYVPVLIKIVASE